MTTTSPCEGGVVVVDDEGEAEAEGDAEEEEDMEAWAVLLADSRMTGGKG